MSSFEQHAFISYAHLDNQPLEPGQQGWVTRFHAALQTRLSQRLGEQARIWRDSKLAGNDVFADEIVDQFPKTALLVSVVTPRYVRSEWCLKELERFTEAAVRSGGLRIGNAQRVVKVAKTPLEPDATVPPVIERTLGVSFYDDGGDVEIEFDPALGAQAREAFLQRIYALAVQMAETLRDLGHGPAAPAAAAARPGTTVYLAECGRDLQAVREQLATDLRLHGHTVLPDRPLPRDEEGARLAIAQAIERSTLAVHLVGSSGGPVPEGPAGRSLVVLQNEVAAQRAVRGLPKRLIWLPEGAVGERPEQQAFIDALPRDASLQAGADLLRGDLEQLKSAMHGALRAAAQPVPERDAAAGSEGAPTVHLVMTESDRIAAVPLVRLLRSAGWKVTTPVFAGDAAQLRQLNAGLVAASTQLLVLYAGGDEAWKVHQLTDLRKQLAMADGPPREPWLVLLPPATPDKLLEQALAGARTIDAVERLDEAALAPLRAAVAPKGAT